MVQLTFVRTLLIVVTMVKIVIILSFIIAIVLILARISVNLCLEVPILLSEAIGSMAQ